MLISSLEPGSRKNFSIPSNLLPQVISEPTIKKRTFVGITANQSKLTPLSMHASAMIIITQHNSAGQLSIVESGAVITAFVTLHGICHY